MNTESLKEAIKRELPEFLRTDLEFRAHILELTRQDYAGRAETQDRFYDLLGELRRDREERTREWEEYKVGQNLKWDDQNRKWDEQNRKWDENQAELRRIHEEIMLQALKHDVVSVHWVRAGACNPKRRSAMHWRGY